MSGHTPAPWLVTGSGDGPYDVQTRDEPKRQVMLLTHVRGGLPDARMAVAAPVLYAHLSELHDWIAGLPDVEMDTTGVLAGIRDVLGYARGEWE